MGDVTHILRAISEGDSASTEALLPIVYAELRRLAQQRLARESPDHTLQATALVHEAYVRLVASSNDGCWENHGHFFAAAAEAMRRILIDHARAKGASKRKGRRCRIELPLELSADAPPEGLMDLDEALQKLEREDPEKAMLVKLRFFAGLTMQQAADAMHISRATANRHWAFARAWLYGEISQSDTLDGSGEAPAEERTH